MTDVMKDLMKIPFPIAESSYFHSQEYLQKSKNKWFQRTQITFFFKNWPTLNFETCDHKQK